MILPLRRAGVLLVLALPFVSGCTERSGVDAPEPSRDAQIDSALDGGTVDASSPVDAAPIDAPVFLDPDAGCATGSSLVEVQRRPVDIIWVVDNSASMEPAIRQVQQGLNNFAALIAGRDLDYRVIVLSLRGRGRTTLGGNERYQVCIPEPLAGDADCGDGDRFFQVEVDIKSTQPVEQILGTLAQTDGYGPSSAIGSEPWRDLLRDDATKTIVVVTDDNSRTCEAGRNGGTTCQSGDPRLTTLSLENFPGPDGNPFNTRTLGPGLRTAAYGDLFEGYTFNAIYGWGSETDPDEACSFSGSTAEPSPGWTYTALVERTGGVRAQICDGAAAWGPFFDAVASTVAETSRIECEVELPDPPAGSLLDPRRVNVQIRGASGAMTIPYAGDASDCDATRGGWHYDDATDPTRVILCPSTCELAREETADTSGGLDVIFGCESIPI